MNELIKVTVQNDQQLVSARDLHKGLEVKGRFSRWIDQNFNLFEEGVDFMPCTLRTQQNQYGGLKDLQDYVVTIDMAKQLSMMSRTENGKQYRKYFIDLERKWNDPQEVVKRGYAILQNENTQLKIENEELRPKALFSDAVRGSKNSCLVKDLATILKQNGIDIGQNRLFDLLRDGGFLCKDKSRKNKPTQKSMDLKIMECREHFHTNSNGEVITKFTPLITGKGQAYFVDKFLGAEVGDPHDHRRTNRSTSGRKSE